MAGARPTLALGDERKVEGRVTSAGEVGHANFGRDTKILSEYRK